MERDPKLYWPDEKYQGLRPQPGVMQLWFHDGIFTNGYSMQLMYHTAPAKSSIWLDVCGPDGKNTNVVAFFDTETISAKTEYCDVKMGDNYVFGKFPKYEMHFRHENMGADFVYECLTQPIFEPPDGVYQGREQSPSTPLYFGYAVRPRCRVTGKLIIEGKEIPVEGEGYGDHEWKYAPPGQFQHHYWTWGKVYLPEHTLVWWDAILNPTFGFQRCKWLWSLSGDKLFEYSNHAGMYVELIDLELTESGATLPKKLVLTIDEPRIKGTATYNIKHIVKNVPIDAFGSFKIDPKTWVGLRHYARFISECHSDFEIDGKRIVADSMESHEVGK
jgi:hypothetical protein